MIKRFLGVMTAASWGRTDTLSREALDQFLDEVNELHEGVVQGKTVADNLPSTAPPEATRLILAHRNFRAGSVNWWVLAGWITSVVGLVAYTFCDPTKEGVGTALVPLLSLVLMACAGYALSLWQKLEAAKYAMRLALVMSDRWQNAVFDQASVYLGSALAVSLIDSSDLQVCKELDKYITPILAHSHEPLTNLLIDKTVLEAKTGKYAPEPKTSRWALRGFRSSALF